MGLNDGSLIVKSKMLESNEPEMDEEEKLFKSLEPTFKSHAKGYKHFYRGQYIAPDISVLLAEQKLRK